MFRSSEFESYISGFQDYDPKADAAENAVYANAVYAIYGDDVPTLNKKKVRKFRKGRKASKQPATSA
jgi:hypothetical protein